MGRERDRSGSGSPHRGPSERRPRGPTVKRRVPVEEGDLARQMLGPRDCNLRRVRESFDVTAVLRGDSIILEGAGENVGRAAAAVNEIRRVVVTVGQISRDDIDRILLGAGAFHRDDDEDTEAEAPGEGLVVGHGREVKARTAGQRLYVRTMRENDVVFCIGPAGTGKTYLAVAMALRELAAGRVRKIMLTRPAVEAGERLGFLPGDMADKVNPYLRPLYDSLQDMMNYAAVERLVEQGVVEVAPLAFMRGRTLGHSFVILDEAQNTTSAQMLMFLTRLGLDSRAVVTGDVTQIDLPDPSRSGLVQACRILGAVEGIGMVHLSELDIVRHHLVRRVIEAYDADRSDRTGIASRASGGEDGGNRAVGPTPTELDSSDE